MSDTQEEFPHVGGENRPPRGARPSPPPPPPPVPLDTTRVVVERLGDVTRSYEMFRSRVKGALERSKFAMENLRVLLENERKEIILQIDRVLKDYF